MPNSFLNFGGKSTNIVSKTQSPTTQKQIKIPLQIFLLWLSAIQLNLFLTLKTNCQPIDRKKYPAFFQIQKIKS